MKRHTFKPIGFGAAAGALVAGLLGQRHEAVRLVFVMTLLNAVSIGAPEALRRCVGGLTARRQVRANAWTAAGMTAVGAGLLLWLAPWLTENFKIIEQMFPVHSWTRLELDCWIGAAAALAVVRILTVGFDAAGDRLSVVLTECLSFAVVAGSLLMTRNTSGGAKACVIACGGLAAVAALIGFVFHRMDARPVHAVPARPFVLLRRVPVALVRTLLYPLLISAVYMTRELPPGSKLLTALAPNGMSIPLLAGFALVELVRADCRRDAMESVPFRALIALGCFLVAAGLAGYAFLLPESSSVMDVRLVNRLMSARFVQLVLASGAAALVLYANAAPRGFAMILLLLLAAFAPMLAPLAAGETTSATLRWGHAAALILAVSALCCAVPDWAQLMRRWKAEGVRRRARRGEL